MRHLDSCGLGAALLAASCQSMPISRPQAPEPWRVLPTGSSASLRGLAVVDASGLWVGGTGGTLLRSTDGGASWHDVAPPDCHTCDFRDVHAFDADTALAMVAGQPARVYRTADGGGSWQIVHQDPRPAAFFDAMAFHGDRGVLCGDPIDGAFVVLTSEDRGLTWRPVAAEFLSTPLPGEAAFAASGSCVAWASSAGPRAAAVVLVTGGGPTRCLTMTPGERAAAAVELPLQNGGSAQGAFSIAIAESPAESLAAPRRAVIVGGDYEHPQRRDGTAAWSEDGGATWRTASDGAGGYRSAVVWCEPDQLLAVGPTGASGSRDGGRTWQVVGTLGFHSLARGQDGSVFACGSDGRVARWVGVPGPRLK